MGLSQRELWEQELRTIGRSQEGLGLLLLQAFRPGVEFFCLTL
jgi:hypothetical protein